MAEIHYTSFPVTSPQHKPQVHNKSVTSWLGHKSVVSVMSCRYPNSITKTVANKLATSLSTAKLRGNGSNGFWALPIVVGDEQFSDMNSGSCLIVVSWWFYPSGF